MNFMPASSSDFPSGATLTRVSVSGTRLTQTAIFIAVSVLEAREKTREARKLICRPLEVRGQADHQVPRQPGREEPLHRLARLERILGERPEARIAAGAHVPPHSPPPPPPPPQREWTPPGR